MRRLAIVLLVLAAACSKEPPAAPREDASKLVTELYREHDAQHGPFFQTDSKASLDKYFEPSLAELIWKDAVDSKGEVGALDFDPLYDAQDVEPKNLTVGAAQPDGESVRVPVSFVSYNEKRQLTYVLARAGNAWRISDILYADGRTLRKVYQ